jgi:predicted CopG family antitoxin
MSTKNIALNARVYELLARHKRESESFSKTIERLLSEVKRHATGSDILRNLGTIPPLTEEEAARFLAVVEDNRRTETWERNDLR